MSARQSPSHRPAMTHDARPPQRVPGAHLGPSQQRWPAKNLGTAGEAIAHTVGIGTVPHVPPNRPERRAPDMTSKPASKKKTDKPKIALSPTLKTVPAVDGVDDLLRLHHQHGLIPLNPESTTEYRLHQLRDLLSRHQVSTFELATNPAAVISALTGVDRSDLTKYHPSEVAERLHAYRNLALAVAVLAASTVAVTSAATHPDAVYAHTVKLARRSFLTRRPLADDEIVLCRVAAHLAALEDPRDHTATIYTLIDAGLVPGETTHFKIDDLDEPELPRLLLAAGNAQVASRFLELDPFTTVILSRHVDHALRAGHSPNTPLTYKPRAPKSADKQQHQPGSISATASAQRIIDRFIGHLGLPTGDITASSITQWRVAHTIATQGVQAALAISGRTNLEAMFRALGTHPTHVTSPTDDDYESFAAAV